MGTAIDDMLYQQFIEDEAHEEAIEEEIKKRLSKQKLAPTEIDDIRQMNAQDDHEDRVSDRTLKENWSKRILTLLIAYGSLNYLLILLIGRGILYFPDTTLVRIFLGGNVAAIPTIAIFITKSLFPQKK